MPGFLALLPKLIKAVDVVTDALPAGSEALDKLRAHRRKMQSFIDEGRDPTQEEFDELQAETNRLTDRLRAADDRLNPRS